LVKWIVEKYQPPEILHLLSQFFVRFRLPDETTSAVAGGMDCAVFVVKEHTKSFPRENGVG